MSATYLGIAAILYLLTSLDLVKQGQYGMALAFLAYAIANLGFILAIYTKGVR